MTRYSVGTRVFMDFIFRGKPRGRITRILAPGTGLHSLAGSIEVELDTGEIVEGDAFTVVPVAQIKPLRAGQYFTRIDTNYEYTNR